MKRSQDNLGIIPSSRESKVELPWSEGKAHTWGPLARGRDIKTDRGLLAGAASPQKFRSELPK